MKKQNTFKFATNSLYKAARKQQGTGSQKRFFIDLEEVDMETFAAELHDGFLPAESFKICWSSVKGDIFNVIPRLQNKLHFAKNGAKKILDKNKIFSRTALRRSQAKTVIAPVSDYALLALGQEVVEEIWEDGSKIILVEPDGDCWYEYEDGLGGLHYGR